MGGTTAGGRVVVHVLLGLGAVILAAALLGPRLRFRPAGEPPEVTRDPVALERWIAEREAAFDDIIPGAEKAIRWADPQNPRRTNYAVVYIHGFSASRREIYPFPQLVADALGANSFWTRLTGHGRADLDAMGRMESADWYTDALEALAVGEAIGERVILVATSTGVTLATVLVEQFPERIHALVAVSPNYGPANRAAWITVAPWGEQIGARIMGPYRSWRPQNEMHGRYWTTRYPSRAIPVMMSLVAYGRRIRHQRLPVPMIQFSAPGDTVIEYDWSIRVYERWGSRLSPAPPKELVIVDDATDPGQHVITGEIRSPENTERLASLALRFLQSLE